MLLLLCFKNFILQPLFIPIPFMDFPKQPLNVRLRPPEQTARGGDIIYAFAYKQKSAHAAAAVLNIHHVPDDILHF
jgi:hypothetical protein